MYPRIFLDSPRITGHWGGAEVLGLALGRRRGGHIKLLDLPLGYGELRCLAILLRAVLPSCGVRSNSPRTVCVMAIGSVHRRVTSNRAKPGQLQGSKNHFKPERMPDNSKSSRLGI